MPGLWPLVLSVCRHLDPVFQLPLFSELDPAVLFFSFRQTFPYLRRRSGFVDSIRLDPSPPQGAYSAFYAFFITRQSRFIPSLPSPFFLADRPACSFQLSQGSRSRKDFGGLACGPSKTDFNPFPSFPLFPPATFLASRLCPLPTSSLLPAGSTPARQPRRLNEPGSLRCRQA